MLRRLRKSLPRARLLVLAGPDKVDVPADLLDAVDELPTLGDAGLVAVMRRAALGLSMSRWEGFNLPLAEMQWIDRPALAFNVGAHPEVVADPWLLCETAEEMARKAALILGRSDGVPKCLGESFARFRERFRWEETLARWSSAIAAQPRDDIPRQPQPWRRLVLVDVSNSARDPANSGVIRVTRRLSRGLSERPDMDVVFVVWDDSLHGGSGGYRLLSEVNRGYLASNGGPTDPLGSVLEHFASDAESLLRAGGDPRSSAPPVLLVPEIALDGSAGARIAWGRRTGCRIAAVFYDMLAIYQPEYIDQSVRAAFTGYLEAMTQTDALWSISGFSQSEFERYARDEALQPPRLREAVWLPGQFSDRPRGRARTEADHEDGSVDILCVATVEPRKNHLTLLEAFRLLRRRKPELAVRLNLVGNSYVGAGELAARVLAAVAEDDHITWHRILPDSVLAERYESATFTVYPSLAEGFGLPVMESLWMGRPCICHEAGVMAELAAEGGCVCIDMTSVQEVAAAMERLASDPALRHALARQAERRVIGTWRDYADAIAKRIADL